jgi:hypothetical protein
MSALPPCEAAAAAALYFVNSRGVASLSAVRRALAAAGHGSRAVHRACYLIRRRRLVRMQRRGGAETWLRLPPEAVPMTQRVLESLQPGVVYDFRQAQDAAAALDLRHQQIRNVLCQLHQSGRLHVTGRHKHYRYVRPGAARRRTPSGIHNLIPALPQARGTTMRATL